MSIFFTFVEPAMTQCLFTRENPSGITHEKELEESTWRDADVDLSSDAVLLKLSEKSEGRQITRT